MGMVLMFSMGKVVLFMGRILVFLDWVLLGNRMDLIEF
jgi:hypothetical protein